MKKRLLYPGFIIFFLALPIAFPPTVSPAKYGGLLGSIKDAESAGDLVKETMTDLMGYLEDSFTAFDSGDTESIERIHEDLKELEGELALKAIPGSGLVEGILNTSQNVKEKLVEGWQSAKDKIDRFFSGDREAVFDSRIALSIDEDEHEWHESEGGVLDELPLQDVTLRSHGDYGDAAGTVDPQESEYYDTEGATGTPGHAETSDQPAEDAGPWEELYDDSEDIADAEEPSQPAEDTGPWEELNDDSEDIADAEASRQPAEDTGPWEELYDDSEDIADAEEPSQPAEDTGPWEELYDDSEDIADAEEPSQPAEDAGPWEELYDDEEGTADQWEYADSGDQPADSVEGMDDGDWENNNYEAALDNIFADENYGSNDPGEEDYSTAFETLQQEEVARRAAEWEAELARQRAEQERAQREAELARQRAEQERAQQKAALARRAAEREAALARQQAKKETSNILGGIVGGLTGQAVDSYLGGDSGLGSTVGGLVGGLLGNDTGAAIGQTLGGFDSGGVGFSESGSGEKYHYSSSTSSGDCNELTPACQQASLAANRQIENLPRDNRSQTERAQLFIKTCDIGIKMNRICYNNEPRPHCQALYKEQIQEYEKARREALQISRSVRE